MSCEFILNRKHQIIGVIDKHSNKISIPVLFGKKNIFIDSNKIGRRKWKSIMLEIENRNDLFEEGFYYMSYFRMISLLEK